MICPAVSPPRREEEGSASRHCATFPWRTLPPPGFQLAGRVVPEFFRLDTVLYSGYILARMRYEILFAPQAVQDLKRLQARLRAEVKDALERHLRHEPQKVSKSRIKRLRGVARPQYRLRVGEIRVFYDITEEVVEVLAIVTKAEAAPWLAEKGG